MDSAIHWVTPLAILPGVALLVLSTATRFLHVHGELQRLRDDGRARSAHDIDAAVGRLVARSRLFRNALISLYLAVAAFSLAALIGGTSMYFWPEENVWAVGACSVVGIGCVVYAAVQLIRESMVCLAVIERYAEEICAESQSD